MSKIATDLKQSKKLAEILPIESADMYWNNSSVIRGFNYVDAFLLATEPYKNVADTYWVKSYKRINPMFEVVPAWSLSALLKVVKWYTLQTISDGRCFIIAEGANFISDYYDEQVDACVELIIKLKEKDLL